MFDLAFILLAGMFGSFAAGLAAAYLAGAK